VGVAARAEQLSSHRVACRLLRADKDAHGGGRACGHPCLGWVRQGGREGRKGQLFTRRPTPSAGAHRRPSRYARYGQRAESVRVMTLLLLLFVDVDARASISRGAHQAVSSQYLDIFVSSISARRCA
jgi:hypothetical protein